MKKYLLLISLLGIYSCENESSDSAMIQYMSLNYIQITEFHHY